MDDYEKLVRAAAEAWSPGHTQPFEDVIAEVNLGSVHFGDADEGRRHRELEYARGQVELIFNLGFSPMSGGIPAEGGEGAKRNIARAIMAELDAREMMGPAKRVAAVIELMRESDQNVQLDDILLWMHLEHHEEVLRRPILETFAALRAQNFDFHDQDRGKFAQHYWDTVDDFVRDALQKHDLLNESEED